MGKRTSPKRLSTVTHSASKSVDGKARKRIEELYELTDEIINAYNEINEKYINQIYRKYKQLQEVNRKMKEQINSHHCVGCKCVIPPDENADTAEEEEDDADEEEEEEENEGSENEIEIDDKGGDRDYRNGRAVASTSPAVDAVQTRSKKNNPFIISDIEDTQNFDGNDSRFVGNTGENEDDADSTMDTAENRRKTASKKTSESGDGTEEEDMAMLWSWAAQGSSHYSSLVVFPEQKDNENVLGRTAFVDENDQEDVGMDRLPLTLQDVIRRKAQRNKKNKSYLLHIPRYPALCEFLRDKSSKSFDMRPSEAQVRPLIAAYFGQHLAGDSKTRMRVRDELREIHRSYMRTFMQDPRVTGGKASAQKSKQLATKTSPA